MDSVSSPVVVGEVGFALRLRPALKADLERWAAAQHRSVNKQIVAALERAVVEAKRRGEIPAQSDSPGVSGDDA